MNGNTILVLSPHTDDGELGAGGTISKFVDEGKDVYYVAFSACEDSLPKGFPSDTLRRECKRATKALGLLPDNITILDYQVRTFPEHRQEILETLVKFRKEIKPDLVIVPSSYDIHQDHSTIYWEALRTFKNEASIWGYEHPWNNLSFSIDVFVSLEPKNIGSKIKAIKEYKSQNGKAYMKEKNILALSSIRGSQLNKPYAEAFELIRLIVD